MECYVFDTLEIAQNALNYINTTGGVPVIGRNALTGELEPSKAKTETWDIIKQRITDNKYYFTRVPVNLRNAYGDNVMTYFHANFPNTIENYNDSWSPDASEVI